MTISWYKILSPLALCMLFGVSGASPAGANVEDEEGPTVVTAHEAFALLPAELIAAPTVIQAESSSDLRYLLVVRQERPMTPMALQAVAEGARLPPFTETALVLWDSLSHESREIWRGPASVGTISRVEWMPGSAAALVKIQSVRRMDMSIPGPAQASAILRVDAASAKVELLAAGSNSTEGLDWTMNPTQPLAVLVKVESAPTAGGRETSETFSGVGAAGPLGPPAVLPRGMDAAPHWAEDGSLVLSTKTSVPNAPDVDATYTLDLPTGKMRSRKPLDKTEAESVMHPAVPPSAADLVDMLPVTLQTTKGRVNDAEGAGNVDMLWLQATDVKPATRILVSLNATRSYILPQCQGIVYTVNGAVWVTPVVRMNRAQYAKAWRYAQMRITTNNAKQLDLALMAWTQDYDEKYPPPDDIKAKLMPYIKDEGVINGFVYTYPGGNLADIEQPSATVLGYVTGPGGQATLYADGHVRWHND